MGVSNFKNYHISRSKKYMPLIEDKYGNRWDNKDICDLLNDAENEVTHLEYAIETLIGYNKVDYLLFLLYDAKWKISQGDVVIDKLDLKNIQVYQDAQIALINYLINELRK